MAREAHTSHASLADELGSLASFIERIAQTPDAAPTPTDLVEAAAGDPNLELSTRLGEGGMGVVYLARDKKLDRQVAVKVQRGSGSPEADGLLLNEAKAMAKLSHPNIVTVYDVRSVGGHLVLLMEYVPGPTLATWLGGERSTDEVVRVLAAAGDGLAAAHAAGLIHRDFKPSNVIVGDDGRVRVADFGLAVLDHSVRSSAGTPAYMAPEQAAGEPIDERADQYAFCVAAIEALDGHELGRRLEAALARGAEPQSADRWPDMQALLAELRPSAKTTRRRIVIAAIAIAAAIGGLLVANQSQGCGALDCSEASATWQAAVPNAMLNEIDAGLRNSGRPFGPAYADRTLASLLRYQERWTAARVESCELGETERSLCLDARLERIKALAQVLREPRNGATDRALDLVDAATANACADSGSWPKSGSDPATTLEGFARVERVAARRLAGDELAARQVLPHQEPSDPALAAALGFQRAALKTRPLAPSLSPYLEPNAATELSLVASDNTATLRDLASSLERDSAPARLQALAFTRLADRLEPSEAVVFRTKALELRRSQLGVGNSLLRPLLSQLGQTLVAAKRPNDARAYLAAAVELGEGEGGDMESFRRELRQLADLDLELRNNNEAKAGYERVRDLTDVADPRHVDAVLGVGLALLHRGDLRDAQAVCEQARERFEGLAERGMSYARARDCIGMAIIKFGEFEAAEQHFRAAVEVVAANTAEPHDVVDYQVAVVSALLAQDKVAEAREFIDTFVEHADAIQRRWLERALTRSNHFR